MCGIVACWAPKSKPGGDDSGRDAGGGAEDVDVESALARMGARGPDSSAWRRYGGEGEGEGGGGRGRHLLGARRLVVRGGGGAAAMQPLEAPAAGGSGARPFNRSLFSST
jgi:asparagine synthetase B (glutamine-hydrolysing)